MGPRTREMPHVRLLLVVVLCSFLSHVSGTTAVVEIAAAPTATCNEKLGGRRHSTPYADMHIGCAEAYSTPTNNAALQLQCTRGTIKSIREAFFGMPSGRCDSNGYKLAGDSATCEGFDAREVLSNQCLGKSECKVTVDSVLRRTNHHQQLCGTGNIRAGVVFECISQQEVDFIDIGGNIGAIGEGHRDVSWFDEEVTLQEFHDREARAAERRGYVQQSTVTLIRGEHEGAVTCGFGYEGDFVELSCGATAETTIPDLDDQYDALSLISTKALPRPEAVAGALRITKIVAAEYGVFSGSCSANIDPKDSTTLPTATCGSPIRSAAASHCIGRPSCRVFVPVDSEDPCPGEKKAGLLVAICDAAA